MALTNRFTYRSDAKQSGALYNSPRNLQSFHLFVQGSTPLWEKVKKFKKGRKKAVIKIHHPPSRTPDADAQSIVGCEL